MAYSKLAEELIEDEWKENESATAKLITEKVNLRLAEQEKPTVERVVERTVRGYLAKLRKTFQEPAPDPILPMWQKAPKTGYGSYLASWPTDPDKIKTLTVLYDEAIFITSELTPDYFLGLRDRMVKWALRISGFFDHEHRLDRLIHLWFTMLFYNEERFLLGMKRDVSELGIQSGYTRALMSWHQRHTEPERSQIRVPFLFPDPPWEMPVDDLADQIAALLILDLGLELQEPVPPGIRHVVIDRLFNLHEQRTAKT